MTKQGGRQRLDTVLFQRGLASSREKAQALIGTGQVLIADQVVDKAGYLVRDDASIRIRGVSSRFVSRGGDKIDAAFEHYRIELVERVALDVGASTGGFCDCMLKRGARRVYAVDVGYNQLSYELRTDSRVVVMERTHAKELSPAMFDEPATIATIDVSFISLRKILPFVLKVLAKPAEVLALVKPQFELSPQHVSKGGIVRREEDHQLAIQLVRKAAETLGWNTSDPFASPLRGQKKGNQEYFLYLRPSGN